MLGFQCPHCMETSSIPMEFIGTRGRCKKCGKPITIEEQTIASPDTSAATFDPEHSSLVVLHCETTGRSSRRDKIIEIGSIKFGLNGEQLDTFWSLTNPGTEIPSKIVDRTGITDDMVADAPAPVEAVKRWFHWVGSHPILFSHHARFNAKFVCACLLKEEIMPPPASMIDVTQWAKDLDLQVREYKLRPLLEHIGYAVPHEHRALETCRSVEALSHHLLKEQAGIHLEAHSKGLLGKISGKKVEAVNAGEAYGFLSRAALPLEEVCGDKFYKDGGYMAVVERSDTPKIARKRSTPETQETSSDGPSVMHMHEWFEERRHILEELRRNALIEDDDSTRLYPEDAEWAQTLHNARQATEPVQQRKLLQEAVSQGALDPWPYETLVKFYVKIHEYESARRVCETYFDTDIWQAARWADSSMRLLRLMGKLERKLFTTA